MANETSDRAVYVYAAIRGGEPENVPGLTGIHGADVRLVDCAGLQAVASDVGLDEFGDDGLHANLEDLGWVEDVARTHDRVVAELSRYGPTAPFRLATICFDDASVRERIGSNRRALADVLDRVEGRDEWGVKVYAAANSTPAGDGATSEESGTAYLARLKAEHAARASEAEADATLAGQIHDAICEVVTASKRMPPQDPRLAGHSETMTLNGTYLVDRARADRLRELVDGLSAEHPEARIELTGPWPPYTFAYLEEQ